MFICILYPWGTLCVKNLHYMHQNKVLFNGYYVKDPIKDPKEDPALLLSNFPICTFLKHFKFNYNSLFA